MLGYSIDSIIKSLIPLVADGGAVAAVAVLIFVVAFLFYERIQLMKQLTEAVEHSIQAKESEKQMLLSIIDKYHQGNLSIVKAIDELRVVLAAIQGRLL